MSPVMEEDGIGEDSASGGTLTGGKYSMTKAVYCHPAYLTYIQSTS